MLGDLMTRAFTFGVGAAYKQADKDGNKQKEAEATGRMNNEPECWSKEFSGYQGNKLSTFSSCGCRGVAKE